GQTHVGHQYAGLDRLWVFQPFRQVCGRVRENARAQGVAAAHMAEVGADVLAYLPKRMAAYARLLFEYLQSLAKLPVGGWRPRWWAALPGQPGVVIALCLGGDPQEHPGVLRATIFGAGPLVDAGAAGLQVEIGGVARSEVELAAELRHPEAVYHVGGLQAGVQALAHRYVDFVGCDYTRLWVSDLPP